AQVSIIGGSEREVKVGIDAAKLKGYGLTIVQVQQLVQGSNLDFPTGSVKANKQDILIRLSGKFNSVDELRNLVVTTTDNGTQVRISDFADVQESSKEA